MNGWGETVLLGREEMGQLSFSRSDMGLGLLPMKSMHLTAQASRHTNGIKKSRLVFLKVREPFLVPAQGRALSH